MFGLFGEKPKPVKKSGVKALDRKVSKALKASNDKCVRCKKGARVGASLFCRKCHKKGNY
jgi:hypothetical protein